MEIDIYKKYEAMNENEKEIFTLGRLSVLNDFDSMCKADAFMGFTDEEFKAVKKFFAFNNSLREAHKN